MSDLEELHKRFKQPEDLLGPQICSICDRNITKSVKILCSECTDDKVFMCLECLRLGKTSENHPHHKSDHDFFVFDNLDFPLLTDDWSALQEIKLVQGIMKCGLGNWVDISEQFVKAMDKTPKECEEHYHGVLMKQAQSIEYESILSKRAETLGDDHAVDPSKLRKV